MAHIPTFDVLEYSLELIRNLRNTVDSPLVDHDLRSQLRRAATSIALNISEGARRTGKDRLHHYRVAAGSAAEVRTALAIVIAWNDVDPTNLEHALELLDRILAILWTLTH